MPDMKGTAVCGTLRPAGTRRREEAESHRLTHLPLQPEDWKETPASSRRAGADSLTDEEELAAFRAPAGAAHGCNCEAKPSGRNQNGFYKVTNVAVNRARSQLLGNEWQGQLQTQCLCTG